MANPLPNWLSRLLGIEPGAGEGTGWQLVDSWPLPPWLTVLLAILALAFVGFNYHRESPSKRPGLRLLLATLRAAALALVLGMIAQYVLMLQRTGLPYLVLIVDDSLSMTTVDRPPEVPIGQKPGRPAGGKPSRFHLARSLLVERQGELLQAIRERYKLRVYFLTGRRIDEDVPLETLLEEIAAAEATGETTPLGKTIRMALDELRGAPPAAVVVLTDGINTDGPPLSEAESYAQRRGVPLYFVAIGDDRPLRDVQLDVLPIDEPVFLGDTVSIEAEVRADGFSNEAAVTLREEGKSEVLARAGVSLAPTPQKARLSFRPNREGEFALWVEVEPQPGETQTDNNRRRVTLRVRNEKIRVLLVAGEPSFEYRYLHNMLAYHSSGTIELRTVLQSADREHAQQDATVLPGFPVDREELRRYDVIVLLDALPAGPSDAAPTGLTTTMLENLADFVEQRDEPAGPARPFRGRALICVAGPRAMPLAYRNTPLARLFPFDLAAAKTPDPRQPLRDGFRARPTELGRFSPMLQLALDPRENLSIWNGLPPLYWMLGAPDVRPGVRVLAEHPTRLGPDGRPLPLVMLRYVGAGKVLFHATDETWRWRYRTGDQYFARYWVQTIRFLARSKLGEKDRQVALTTDQPEYHRGAAVRLRARFENESMAPAADDGVAAVVDCPGQPSRRVALRRGGLGRDTFEAILENLAPGRYHATLVAPVVVGQSPAVDFAVVAPPGELQRLQMDSQAMQHAAAATTGKYLVPAAAEQLPESLPKGHQVPIEPLPPRPLWNSWPVLVLLLALLAAEWILRKVTGLA